MSKPATKLIAVLILVSLIAIEVFAVCNYTLISEGSETNANLCPNGSSGTYYVVGRDFVKWSDKALPSMSEVIYNNFVCATDTAKITRSAGFWNDGGEPAILFKYYKMELSYTTTNVPNTKFVVDEYFDMSCGQTQPTPIVINFDHSALQLTSAESGADFDLLSDGTKQRLGWTRANSNVAFLIRGTSATSGRQLFGNLNEQAPPATEGESENGYRALRAFDANNDKEINAADQIWQELHLWFDRNHNGVSEPNEVEILASRNVASISLEYLEVGKKDQYGNKQRFRAKVTLADGSLRWSTDFYPAISDAPISTSVQVIGPARGVE